jgi:hypothetical protein
MESTFDWKPATRRGYVKRGESEDSFLRDEIEVVITTGAGEDD